ncbi:MAG: 3-hydroxyacyl-CoA dehydrogenase, partial [Paracoccaceae bacterium]
MTDFTMTTDADGIAVITWDCVEKSMNVLDWDALRTLDGFIDTLIADEAVKGAIITSGKKDFAAGMDLNVLADLRNASGDNP